MQKKVKKPLFNMFTKKPVPLLTGFYIVFIVMLISLGLFYIANKNNILQNEIRPMLSDSLFVVPELTAREPQTLAAIDMKTLSAPTPEMISKGKQTFATVCVSCHGAEGKGDGVAGVALNPKPRNFHLTEGWKNGRKVSEIYKTLQLGIAGSGMPAYDNMTPLERLEVISFIRSTFMTDPPLDAPAEIDLLDKTYKLSAGVEQPGQLPVSGVVAGVNKANSGLNAKLNSIAAEMKHAETVQQGLVILRRVSDSPEKALYLFARHGNRVQNVEQFRNLVRPGIGRNGFLPAFNLLDESEMQILFSTLKQKLS